MNRKGVSVRVCERERDKERDAIKGANHGLSSLEL